MAKKIKKKTKKVKMLQNINPNTAGIDIGATEIYTAAPYERDDQPVCRFDSFTADLHDAAKFYQAKTG